VIAPNYRLESNPVRLQKRKGKSLAEKIDLASNKKVPQKARLFL
jgi:hypothetical protein